MKREKESDMFAELREVIGWQKRQMLIHNQLNKEKHAKSSEAEIQVLCKCIMGAYLNLRIQLFLAG